MKYFLHIDTSGDISCIAVALNGKLICCQINDTARNHAATINNMINSTLSDAGILITDLSAVVVCGGPGSYTGLRIGMATAKGLCYALDIPLLLDNKLTLLAYQNYERYKTKYDFYFPVLLARDKEFFISIHDNKFINTVQPIHIEENNLEVFLQEKKQICIISQCFTMEKYAQYAGNIEISNDIDIHLESWVFYTFQQYKCNNIVNLSTSEPFYLKQVYTHK